MEIAISYDRWKEIILNRPGVKNSESDPTILVQTIDNQTVTYVYPFGFIEELSGLFAPYTLVNAAHAFVKKPDVAQESEILRLEIRDGGLVFLVSISFKHQEKTVLYHHSSLQTKEEKLSGFVENLFEIAERYIRENSPYRLFLVTEDYQYEPR